MNNDKPTLKGRLSFIKACLSLAKVEIKKYGNKFLEVGEDVYDSACHYGAKMSPKITRQEVLDVAKMSKAEIQAIKD